MSETNKRGVINILQEFSVPLLSGVLVAMVWANLDYESYEHVIHWVPIADFKVFGHLVTHHWLVNDIFMGRPHRDGHRTRMARRANCLRQGASGDQLSAAARRGRRRDRPRDHRDLLR